MKNKSETKFFKAKIYFFYLKKVTKTIVGDENDIRRKFIPISFCQIRYYLKENPLFALDSVIIIINYGPG